MPRFVRIHQQVIHVPSLANVSMGTTCLGQPFLTFYYHNQHSQTISYGWGKWEECEKDLIQVKTAMMETERVLSSVLLTEKTQVVDIATVEFINKTEDLSVDKTTS
jgi:hypothetical protein